MRPDPRDLLPSAVIAALCFCGIAFVLLIVAIHKASSVCVA